MPLTLIFVRVLMVEDELRLVAVLKQNLEEDSRAARAPDGQVTPGVGEGAVVVAAQLVEQRGQEQLGSLW